MLTSTVLSILLVIGPHQIPVTIPVKTTSWTICQSIVANKLAFLRSQNIQASGICIDGETPR